MHSQAQDCPATSDPNTTAFPRSQKPTLLRFPDSLNSDQLLDVAAGKEHSAFLFRTDDKLQVLVCGSNSKGQLGPRPLNATWNVITIPTNQPDEARPYSCWNTIYVAAKRLGDGKIEITGWGASSSGQLASGKEQEMNDLVRIGLPFDVTFGQLACGSEHVLLADKRSSTVFGWGWNEHANLGLGHTQDVTSVITLYESQSTQVRCWAGNGTSWIYIDDKQEQAQDQ